MTDFIYSGLPEGVVYTGVDGEQFISNIPNLNNISKSFVYKTNITNQIVISPSSVEKQIEILGITLIGSGSSGTVKLTKLNGDCVLPMYISVQARASASGSLNVKLPVGESLYITITSLQASTEVFVGVTYFER